ncbi:hypothetical protein AC062_1648 [Pasteurellaceae bacterium NI1060]|nr:hypothetical protein AC062_1648 [Pasteurellaceae bacterium NI1060]
MHFGKLHFRSSILLKRYFGIIVSNELNGKLMKIRDKIKVRLILTALY